MRPCHDDGDSPSQPLAPTPHPIRSCREMSFRSVFIATAVQPQKSGAERGNGDATEGGMGAGGIKDGPGFEEDGAWGGVVLCLWGCVTRRRGGGMLGFWLRPTACVHTSSFLPTYKTNVAAPLPDGGLGEEEVAEVLRMRQTPDLYKRLAERYFFG